MSRNPLLSGNPLRYLNNCLFCNPQYFCSWNRHIGRPSIALTRSVWLHRIVAVNSQQLTIIRKRQSQRNLVPVERQTPNQYTVCSSRVALTWRRCGTVPRTPPSQRSEASCGQPTGSALSKFLRTVTPISCMHRVCALQLTHSIR